MFLVNRFLTYRCSRLLRTCSSIKTLRCLHSFISCLFSSCNMQNFSDFFQSVGFFWLVFLENLPSVFKYIFKGSLLIQCKRKTSAPSHLIRSFDVVCFPLNFIIFVSCIGLSSIIHNIDFNILNFCILLAQIYLGLIVKIHRIHWGSLSKAILKLVLLAVIKPPTFGRSTGLVSALQQSLH